MILAERHIIKKSNKEFKKIDNLCFLSKNLYNAVLYRYKQYYEETGKHLGFNEVEKEFRLSKQKDFIALPPNTSQQIIMIVDRNYKSFFSSIIAYKKSKNKFKGIPKPPKYKHKTKGRNLLIFTINQARLKNGFIKFPKKTGLRPVKTKATSLQQVRIIPQTGCYVIEVIYKKDEIKNENLDKNLYLSVDLGLNNLAAVTSNQPGLQPILIGGRVLKSMNQYYNKQKASFQSKLKNKKSSNKIQQLSLKRNNKIKNYMHHASKFLVNYAVSNNVGNIIIGYNEQWKDEINIGKRSNQNFVLVPFLTFINQIKYKAALQGIEVSLQEESYTSKCSYFDNEEIKKHDKYLGRRVKRGLFKTSGGSFVNADVNASLNIMSKYFQRTKETDDVLSPSVIKPVSRGLVHNPVLARLSTK